MKLCKLLLLLSTPFLHAGFFDWSEPLSPKAEKAQIALEGFDKLIEKALADFQVPGLAIAVVVDGHVVYSKGFGLRNIEAKQPVTKETLFPIGSCTKAFTTFAMGGLVDEGLFEWDQPVIDILPEFRLWDDYSTAKVTVRDLLTHRTGIPRHDFVWYNSKMTKQELLKRMRYLPPTFALKERYHYGQLTYFSAGLVLEKAAGKSWEAVVQERILNPLGMNTTNFTIEALQKSGNFASPYMEKNELLRKVPFRNLSLIGPAGAMNSNVEDLSHWLQMQLAGGVYKSKALISPATLQELHAPQVIVPGVPESKETLLYTYGMGWLVLSYRGHYFASHDGISDGFTSMLGILPSENIGIVILCNKNMTSLPRYLSFAALDRVLNLPSMDWLKEGTDSLRKNRESMKQNKLQENLQRKKDTTTCHPIEEYVGIYEHPGYGKLAIELIDGKLEIHYNDLAFVLDHWHYETFLVSKDKQDMILSFEGAKIHFANNSQGDIGEIVVPFEPTSNGIIFKRKPAAKHGTLTYLRRFAGTFEIYGYTVEIALKNHSLTAIIPGQPNYELIPSGENEFTVKSLTGTTVRFLMDGDTVKEVLLIYPYGAFSAMPKK